MHSLPPTQATERLRFIDFRALWMGRVNRSDLMDAFAISEAQASLDLRRYNELYAGMLRYDPSEKAYVTSPEFRPSLLPDSPAENYLGQILSLGLGETTTGGTWLGDAPPAEVLSQGRKRVPTEVLRAVLFAMRSGRQLRIRYQSKTSVEPVDRWIAPYAFVYDGVRWHARAWCAQNKEFRDFVLYRMLSIGETRDNNVDPKADMEWHIYVTLHLAPHPQLDPAKRRAVEVDFNMSGGMAQVTTRACFVHYLEWNLRLDASPAHEPRWSGEVVLQNRQQVKERCDLAKELSKQAAAHFS